uniref:Putative ovule protein n=1 Tax=Solanum chacoense TaxID=4108 RepID=A0A0V0HQD8_SOLCH
MSATRTKLLAIYGASPQRGHASSKHNFKLPWQLAWPRIGSSSRTLRVAPEESYPNVLTLKIFIKTLGSPPLTLDSKHIKT